jgi:outer membrane protein OmpA-like peptidoglycan-associated protein
MINPQTARYFMVAALSLWMSAAAQAQNTAYDLVTVDSTTPSSEEIIRALTPVPSLDDPPRQRAMALRIRFEPDTFNLSHETRVTLENLGSALNSQVLTDFRFRIEAHTDALGDQAFNQSLSEIRARGLADYLVASFSIAPERLEPVGLGGESLINPDQPGSARNRVILIINLGH